MMKMKLKRNVRVQIRTQIIDNFIQAENYSLIVCQKYLFYKYLFLLNIVFSSFQQMTQKYASYFGLTTLSAKLFIIVCFPFN